MMHVKHRITRIGVVVALAGVSTVAFAGLKDKPPEGVTLAGIEWQLDKYNSDDPSAAFERANRQAQQATSSRSPVFSGDDPFGRHVPGGDPTRGRPGSPMDRDPGSGGDWHPDRGGNPADVDPIGNQSITMQLGNANRGSIFFESLRNNPQMLSFHEGVRSVTVTEDGLETECEAGVKAPFSDSYGDGQRNCGWNGRAWVVETTRAHSFNRTDRYELSKNGRTLTYTTTAKEDGVGRVTITRKYQIPPAR